VSSREPKTKQIELSEGWTARVGCSDADNDELTFRSFFPQDWWLHVNGCPGSHVVLHHAEEVVQTFGMGINIGFHSVGNFCIDRNIRSKKIRWICWVWRSGGGP
jgi:hypothetical protein